MTTGSDKKSTAMSDAHVVAEQPLTMIESLEKAVEIENELGFGILTEDAQILRIIKSEPDHLAAYYLKKSSVSPQRFGAIISKLVTAGLIETYPCEKNAQDMRFR